MVILDSFNRDGPFVWAAKGIVDNETMYVTLYKEHCRAIERAGYNVTFDKPEVRILGERPVVTITENENGRRRIAAAMRPGQMSRRLRSRPMPRRRA